MAASLRVRTILQNYLGCGCFHLNINRLSFLVTQGNSVTLMSQKQWTCPVSTSHNRQKITFTKQRRRFVPRHMEDGVSTNMKLVFENSMHGYTFWGQLLINVLALPVYGLSFNTILTFWNLQDFSITYEIWRSTIYISLYTLLLFGVNGLGRRNIHRIYSDEDCINFAAVVQDWNFMNKTVHFDTSNTRRKDAGKHLGHFFGNLVINNRSYLVTPTDFVLPKYYNVLMGYDLQRSIDQDSVKDIDIKDFFPSRVSEKPKSLK